MRLSDQQRTIIRSSVAENFGADAVVRLFGSRTDDSQRGGDIDLLIETKLPLEHRIQDECRLAANCISSSAGAKLTYCLKTRSAPCSPFMSKRYARELFMTPLQNNQLVLAQLLKVTAKEAHYLQRTAARLDALTIDLAWVKSLENSDEHSEMLDAFVSRYARLQDTLGDKLLPVMLRACLERTGSELDNLLRAEKLGWIASTEAWIALRELRNRLIHEYMESDEDLLSALQQALLGVKTLSDTQQQLTAYAQKVAA